MGKPKLTGASLRDEIILAAGQLFYENGYSKTSVQDIVDAVGVTKGSFYYYFQGKEDLLFLIHDEYISRVLQVAREIEANGEFSPYEKLRQLVFDIVRGIGEGVRPNANIFLQEIKHLEPEHKQITRRKRKEYHNLLTKIIREGMDSGEFRKDMDPRIVALGVLGMCLWTCQWIRADGPRSVDEIGETFAELLLKGLVQES